METEKKKHIQTKVNKEEFKKIKKKAIDLGITVEEFLRQSALIITDISAKEKDE